MEPDYFFLSFSPDTILEFLCEYLITRLYRIQTINGLRSKIEKVPRDIQVTCTWSCWNWKWLKIRPIAYLSMGNVPTYFEDTTNISEETSVIIIITNIFKYTNLYEWLCNNYYR